MINRIIAETITSGTQGTPLVLLTGKTGRQTAIRELNCYISLPSIAEAPTYSADPALSKEAREALFWSTAQNAPSKIIRLEHSKGNGTWMLIADMWIFNRTPYYTEDLLSRFTALGSLYLPPRHSIRMSVQSRNSGLLTAGDSLRMFGQVDEY